MKTSTFLRFFLIFAIHGSSQSDVTCSKFTPSGSPIIEVIKPSDPKLKWNVEFPSTHIFCGEIEEPPGLFRSSGTPKAGGFHFRYRGKNPKSAKAFEEITSYSFTYGFPAFKKVCVIRYDGQCIYRTANTDYYGFFPKDWTQAYTAQTITDKVVECCRSPSQKCNGKSSVCLRGLREGEKNPYSILVFLNKDRTDVSKMAIRIASAFPVEDKDCKADLIC